MLYVDTQSIMRKYTIQMQEHKGEAERIWTDALEYNGNGITFYEKNKPDFRIFIPYTSIRMIIRDDR